MIFSVNKMNFTMRHTMLVGFALLFLFLGLPMQAIGGNVERYDNYKKVFSNIIKNKISKNKLQEFVKTNFNKVAGVEFNLKSIGKNVKVNLCDAKRYLLTTTKKFDVIFYDPPYENKDIEEKD